MYKQGKRSFKFTLVFFSVFAVFAAQRSAHGTDSGSVTVISKTKHTITIRTNGNGTVSKNPDFSSGYPLIDTCFYGDTVTLTAVPNPGYIFDRWWGEGLTVDSNNPLVATVSMTADRHLAAYFAPVPASYRLFTYVEGQGRIVSNPSLDPATGSYQQGTVVTLTAIPDSGWKFSNWSYSLADYIPPYDTVVLTTWSNNGLTEYMNDSLTITVTMNSNIRIVAVFTRTALPAGSARYIAGRGGNITYHGAPTVWNGLHKEVTVSMNEAVQIQAIPDSGYVFLRWSDGSTDPLRDVRPDISTRNNEFTAFFDYAGINGDNLVCLFRPCSGYNGGWAFNISESGSIQADGKAVGDTEYAFTITKAGRDPRDVRLTHNIILDRHKTYELNFRARAQSPRTVVVTVESGSVAERWEVFLTTEVREFRKTFTTGAVPEPNSFPVMNVIDVSFNSGHEAVNWNLSDVNLVLAKALNVNQAAKQRPNTAAWSVKQVGNKLQLNGPNTANAKISFYDMRGKLVKTISKTAGTNQILMLNSLRIPSGSYIMAVKNNSSGHEVYRTKVTLTKR
ncbi:MAG: T9SS type A sorting domain-containing protein [Chitinispirillales bacterium]|jgi:hypothetical protein|nr:T9SS type A sorting domain-containing protein [Chitinispirillales bacterium]